MSEMDRIHAAIDILDEMIEKLEKAAEDLNLPIEARTIAAMAKKDAIRIAEELK